MKNKEYYGQKANTLLCSKVQEIIVQYCNEVNKTSKLYQKMYCIMKKTLYTVEYSISKKNNLKDKLEILLEYYTVCDCIQTLQEYYRTTLRENINVTQAKQSVHNNILLQGKVNTGQLGATDTIRIVKGILIIEILSVFISRDAPIPILDQISGQTDLNGLIGYRDNWADFFNLLQFLFPHLKVSHLNCNSVNLIFSIGICNYSR